MNVLREEHKGNFKKCYELILRHDVFTLSNKNWKKRIKFILFVDILLILSNILLLTKSQSEIIYFLFNFSKSEYRLLQYVLLYYTLFFISMTIYHVVSLHYEHRHKYELCRKNIKGCCPKILYGLYIGIHFPWILCLCIILKVVNKLKIGDIAPLLPAIIVGYFMQAVVILQIVSLEINVFGKLISKGVLYLGGCITECTYLYFFVLFSITFSLWISNKLVKWLFDMYTSSNTRMNKTMYKQYELLNAYVMILITFFLKAIHFSDVMQNLVDALFYSTTLLTLIIATREKAAQC